MVEVGDGNTCSLWNDVWTGDECFADRFLALFSHSNIKTQTVKEAKTSGIRSTLVPRLSTMADHELQLAQRLLDQTSLSAAQDKRILDFLKPDNNIDTGAIYKMLKARGQSSDPKATFIWNTWAPPRVQLFMWLLLQRRIQCRTVLFTKHIVDSPTCEICNIMDETPEHIIHGFSLGKEVWRRLNLQSMISMDMGQLHTLSNHTSTVIPELPSFIALVCWQVWKARNAKVFRNEEHSV